jgi:hypothetical protein
VVYLLKIWMDWYIFIKKMGFDGVFI